MSLFINGRPSCLLVDVSHSFRLFHYIMLYPDATITLCALLIAWGDFARLSNTNLVVVGLSPRLYTISSCQFRIEVLGRHSPLLLRSCS